MAVSTTAPSISAPDLRAIILPILSSLPGAAASTIPATTILPLLSPILRQRVQYLSSASTEPWIRLLTYDTSNVPKLTEIAQGGSLEPHPVSGEIEIDWDYDLQSRYRRIDEETLQTLVLLESFDLFVRLVYCVGDKEGGGDGWRVGEVGVASSPSPLAAFEGASSIAEAEKTFAQARLAGKQNGDVHESSKGGIERTDLANGKAEEADEEDDDDYWARYDATPARTPAVKRSPAPASMMQNTTQNGIYRSTSAEDDDYYAQYDSVQPAMDPHDPDEEEAAAAEQLPAPPLGLARPSNWPSSDGGAEQTELNKTSGAWILAEPGRSKSPSQHSARSRQEDEERAAGLLHPRPASSASSNGSRTVARLEETAERRDQSEFGVKQHISRSIRSLFLLSRASGIDREEFERMIKTELDVLGMVEDEI